MMTKRQITRGTAHLCAALPLLLGMAGCGNNTPPPGSKDEKPSAAVESEAKQRADDMAARYRPKSQ